VIQASFSANEKTYQCINASELALDAVDDKAVRKKLGKLLTGFRDESIDLGFDAALAYEVKDGQLRLYGISGASDIKVAASSLPVGEAKDQKKFNIAVYKALATLPYLTPP
jgi:hypothetical protein